jgi:hypothetical protein
MEAALYVIAALVVFGIAAGVVGREVKRLAAQPPRAVFDLEEAVEWVAGHVPFEVAAELSHADVREIFRWHLQYFRIRGVSADGETAQGPVLPVVVGGEDAVDYVLARAEQAGRDLDPDHVRTVLEVQMAYLSSIGAVGPPARPGEVPPPDPPG